MQIYTINFRYLQIIEDILNDEDILDDEDISSIIEISWISFELGRIFYKLIEDISDKIADIFN